MVKDQAVVEYFDALMDFDYRKMRRILRRSRAQRHVEVNAMSWVLRYVEESDDHVRLPEIYRGICQCIDQGIRQMDLSLYLISAVTVLGYRLGRSEEAESWMALLEDHDQGELLLPVQVSIKLTEHARATVMGRLGEASEVMKEILELEYPDQGPFWQRMMIRRVTTAINHEQLVIANVVLYELRPFLDLMPVPLKDAWYQSQARYCLHMGRYHEGLRYLDQIQDQSHDQYWTRYVQILLTMFAGKSAEALELVDQVAASEDPIMHPACFYAQAALLRGDLRATRRYLNEALGGEESTQSLSNVWALGMLADLELNEGHTREARRLLTYLDAEGQRHDLLSIWLRLAIQEKDDARALLYVKKLVALGGEILVFQRLITAHELSKFDVCQLISRSYVDVEKNGERQELIEEDQAKESDRDGPLSKLLGQSDAMVGVRQQIQTMARHDASVLISGETGVGKEVVASLLHELSPRAQRAFVPVNCAAISETLIESELFGHAKGAFTGAGDVREGLFVSADGGTILLDEIHAMQPRLQAALLRVLESGEIRAVGSDRIQHVNVRVMAATNMKLEEMVQAGSFRSDLYYRLAHLQIEIPPLRDRIEDIPLLADHFVEQVNGDRERILPYYEGLQRERWPGNVRELKHHVERLCILLPDQVFAKAPLAIQETKPEHLSSSHSVGTRVQHDSERSIGQAVPDLNELPLNLKNTRSRRHFLMQCFEKHRSLTQQQLVQMTGSSPTTIRKDLRAMCDESLINRVDTSGNLKTSYYEILD